MRILGAGVAALILVAGCGSSSDAASVPAAAVAMHLPSAKIRIFTVTDSVIVDAELATTSEQHTMGLMERTQLAPSAGMLFVYPVMQPESSAFWMFRTRIPLDIAFIDSLGGIRTIHTMQPCTSVLAGSCESYPARARYQAALEVNAGYFASKGIRVGDRVWLADTVRHK